MGQDVRTRSNRAWGPTRWPLAAFVRLVLVADAAERECGGYRLERGLGDGDADHGGSSRARMSLTCSTALAGSSRDLSPCKNATSLSPLIFASRHCQNAIPHPITIPARPIQLPVSIQGHLGFPRPT